MAFFDQTVLSARRPVAKVGNEVITTHDWQVRTRFARTQLINQYHQTAQIASFFGSDPNSGSYFQSLRSFKLVLSSRIYRDSQVRC